MYWTNWIQSIAEGWTNSYGVDEARSLFYWYWLNIVLKVDRRISND